MSGDSKNKESEMARWRQQQSTASCWRRQQQHLTTQQPQTAATATVDSREEIPFKILDPIKEKISPATTSTFQRVPISSVGVGNCKYRHRWLNRRRAWYIGQGASHHSSTLIRLKIKNNDDETTQQTQQQENKAAKATTRQNNENCDDKEEIKRRNEMTKHNKD